MALEIIVHVVLCVFVVVMFINLILNIHECIKRVKENTDALRNLMDES